jgi:hypothetical protein
LGTAATAVVVTTGDASVRPYPSCTVTPKRSCIADLVPSWSVAAPETHNLTAANESRGAASSSRPAQAS